ncbi:MAG: acyl-CoA dehydrogenase family protein, partial [Reyranella sp.]
MDFSFSEQHEAVRETVRRLCQTEHQKLVAAAEENEVLPREVFARWGELGLLGVRYPEADGGSGLDKV